MSQSYDQGMVSRRELSRPSHERNHSLDLSVELIEILDFLDALPVETSVLRDGLFMESYEFSHTCCSTSGQLCHERNNRGSHTAHNSLIYLLP